MKKMRIYQLGDPVIRQKAKKVLHPTSPIIKRLIQKMMVAMNEANLVGIAAPQIGVGLRVFLTQPRKTTFRVGEKEEKLRIYINPKIVSMSKKTAKAYEGCGSVVEAGLFGEVPRSTSVTIRAQDEQGAWFTLVAKDFLARIIQHEYDHLEGAVFLDRVENTKSLLGRKAYLKLKRSKK